MFLPLFEMMFKIPGLALNRRSDPPRCSILHLAAISAPRMGSSTREDESFAFASREYLRALLVNKEVFISVLHSVKSSDNNQGGSGVYATVSGLREKNGGEGRGAQADLAFLSVALVLVAGCLFVSLRTSPANTASHASPQPRL